MPLDEFRRANLVSWEDRVPIHLASEDYSVAAFAEDPSRISGVVAFDAARLGDVRGKRLLHLQCHFGRDTLSWAALGAEVTGVDFSPSALVAAHRLSEQTRLDARFVRAELYDAPAALGGERFDVVYTGVGALNWLPDVRGWARVVAALLAPGGTLYLRESHPLLWALDDERRDEALVLRYPYFETAEPLRWEFPTSYAGDGTPLDNPVTYEWNHGLGEIVTALLDAGLRLTGLEEHREVEWRALPWMVPTEDGRYALPEGRDRLPLMYTLTATR